MKLKSSCKNSLNLTLILFIFDTALRLHTYSMCFVYEYICRPLVLRCGHDRLLMCKVYNQEHLLNEDVLQSVTEIKLSIHSTLMVVCI